MESNPAGIWISWPLQVMAFFSPLPVMPRSNFTSPIVTDLGSCSAGKERPLSSMAPSVRADLGLRRRCRRRAATGADSILASFLGGIAELEGNGGARRH